MKSNDRHNDEPTPGSDQENWQPAYGGGGNQDVERRSDGVADNRRTSRAASTVSGPEPQTQVVRTRRIPPDYPDEPPRRRRAGPILVGLFILILLLTIAVLLGMVLAPRPPAAAPTTVVITPSSTPSSDPALPTETEFPTPSATPTEQVTPSGAPGGAAPDSSKPQWQGQVRVTDDGIDLDPVPPSKGGSWDVAYYADRNVFFFNYVVMSPWTGTGEPTYEDCLNLTSTQALSSSEAQNVRYQEGASYCTWTSADKLTFVRPMPPASGDGIQVNATIW